MKPDRRIVGLDIASLYTGWSLINYKTKSSITFSLDDFGIVTASGRDMISRMGIMAKRILDKVIILSPDRVYVEDPLFAKISNNTTTIRLAQLNYHTCQIIRMAGFEVVNVQVRTARSMVLGKNPSKNVKREVMKHYLVIFPELKGKLPRKYDDVTDSILIADAGDRIRRKAARWLY